MGKTNVYELYQKAKEAYDAIPKDSFAVKVDNTKYEITLSCPKCGALFAVYPLDCYHSFSEPVFCCGKLLTRGLS